MASPSAQRDVLAAWRGAGAPPTNASSFASGRRTARRLVEQLEASGRRRRMRRNLASTVACSPQPLGAPRPAFQSAFAEATAQLARQGVQLGQVTGVATRGHALYLIHRGSNRFFSTTPMTTPAIVKLSTSGSLLGTLRGAPFVVPHGLSIDHRGHLWATDVATHCVYRIDASTGQVLLTLGTGRPGTGPTAFNMPADVAVSERTDEVYVADGYGNARVAVFTYDGRFLRQWGAAGAGAGQFRVVHSVTLDAEDNVYVADRENARVQVFSPRGQLAAAWPSRDAALHAQGGPRGPGVWARHLSSVAYSRQLGLLVALEGNNVVLRTPGGCLVGEAAAQRMQWPHDAVLVAGGGGTQPAIVVAEMDAHQLVAYPAPQPAKGLASCTCVA